MTTVKRGRPTHDVILAFTSNDHVIANASLDIVRPCRCRLCPCSWTDQHQIGLPTACGCGRRVEVFAAPIDVAIHEKTDIGGGLVGPNLPAGPIARIEIIVNGVPLQDRRVHTNTGIEQTTRRQNQAAIAQNGVIALPPKEQVIICTTGNRIAAKARRGVRGIDMEQDFPNEPPGWVSLRCPTTGGQPRIHLLRCHLDETMPTKNHIISGTCINRVAAICQSQTCGRQTCGIHEMTPNDVIITGTTEQHIPTLATDNEISRRAAINAVIATLSRRRQNGMQTKRTPLDWQSQTSGTCGHQTIDLGMITNKDVGATRGDNPVRTVAAQDNVIAARRGDRVIAAIDPGQ